MKTFKSIAAQGDLLLIKIDSIPEGLTQVEPEGTRHILAHSETGHHHTVDVMDAIRPNVTFYKTGSDLLAYLHVTEETPVIHQRDFDTHEPILIPPGEYEIRRQQEWTPEGYRVAKD